MRVFKKLIKYVLAIALAASVYGLIAVASAASVEGDELYIAGYATAYPYD